MLEKVRSGLNVPTVGTGGPLGAERRSAPSGLAAYDVRVRKIRGFGMVEVKKMLYLCTL